MINGQVVTNTHLMSEVFATVFLLSNVCLDLSSPPHQVSDSVMKDIVVRPAVELLVLSGLVANPSMGPDDLHLLLLKSSSSKTAYPLSLLASSVEIVKCCSLTAARPNREKTL